MPLKITKKAQTKPAAVSFDHVEVVDLDVLLLQTSTQARINLEDVVFNVFDSERSKRRDASTWLAFHHTAMPHHAGKSEWIGLSKSVPAPVVAFIQRVLEAAGLEVERDMGRALHLRMLPFARLSTDGLELLVPAALVGDPTTRREIDRGGVTTIARGYTALPSAAAELNRLFFG